MVENLGHKRINENLFFQRVRDLRIKEGLQSDTIAAVGHLQQNIVKYAMPNLIGRNIISVMPTKEPFERFPLEGKAVGYTLAEGTACRFSGDKVQYVTINNNQLAEASEQWTREFVEDASPNAVKSIEQRIADALALDETKAILELYGCIEDDDLADGSTLDWDGAVMDWNAVLALHDTVKGENWKPTVLVLSETQLHQLLLDDKFIEYDALPAKGTDLEAGTIRRSLGMIVQSSNLVPNGTAYAVDTRVSGVMLMRRDVTVEDWSNPQENKYGLKATTRFGSGILRSNAIAKMTNIKTTLK
jgi:hypothetical protein